jgi:hypothetical protein
LEKYPSRQLAGGLSYYLSGAGSAGRNSTVERQHGRRPSTPSTFEALTEKVEQALLKFANIPAEILALCSLPIELAEAA